MIPQTFGCFCCGGDEFTTVRSRSSDGSWRAWRLCSACGGNFSGNGNWIKLTKLDFDNLPIYQPYAVERVKCAVVGCDIMTTQGHHYYPRGIAEKTNTASDAWPVGPLCTKHHVIWHYDVEGVVLNRKVLRELGKLK